MAPSISSTCFSRFLNPSMDRKSECTEGVLSFVSPLALALCFAPIAACSYFSTPSILPVSFMISDVASYGARVLLVGWVEASFSWSTMLSTSSSLASNAFCVLAICCNYSVVAGSVVMLDLVFLFVFTSSLFSLSSNAAILPIRSAITSFRWFIFSSAS